MNEGFKFFYNGLHAMQYVLSISCVSVIKETTYVLNDR